MTTRRLPPYPAALAGVPALCALLALAWPLVARAAGGDAHGYAIDELALLRWVTIGVAIANLGIAASLWLASRRKAEAEALQALEVDLRGEIKEHARMLHQAAAALAAMPTHDHLADVYRDVKAINRQVSQLCGQLTGMNDNLRLLIARSLGE